MTKEFSHSIGTDPPHNIFERLVNTPDTGTLREIATAKPTKRKEGYNHERSDHS